MSDGADMGMSAHENEKLQAIDEIVTAVLDPASSYRSTEPFAYDLAVMIKAVMIKNAFDAPPLLLLTCLCKTQWETTCQLHGIRSQYYRKMSKAFTPNSIKLQHVHIDGLESLNENLSTGLESINKNLGEIENTIRKGNVVTEHIGESLTSLNRNVEALIRVLDNRR